MPRWAAGSAGMLRTVAANRDLARLEAVWACVSLVRWALAILVGLYAYREAGATGVGVAALVRMLPAAVLAPRLSVLVDRRSRRQVLLMSLLLRTALAVGLAAAVGTGGSLAVVLVLAAAYGVVECLQRPAQAALLGVHARNPAQLAAANTLWSMLDNTSFLVGSLFVGTVVALAGTPEAFWLCAPVLAVASVVGWRLSPDLPPPPVPGTSRSEQAMAGVRTVATDRQLRLLVGILAVDMFVQAMVDVLLVVAALGLLDMGEDGAGWLSAAWGAGGVAGGVVAAVFLARRRLARGLTTGLVTAGLPLVAIGIWPEQAVALAMLAVMGVGFGTLEAVLLTLTQRLVAADVLGRVYGVQETLAAAAMTLGSVVAAGLVALTGEAGALVVAGAVLPVLALVAVGGMRRLDSGAEAPEGVFETLRAVPAFATLPVALVESLAVRARRERREAGSEVVRQGEPGDTFYVIAEGEVGVTEDGVLRRTQSAGDFFGEIALLHRVPRTATVRTLERTDLVVLEQDDFLAAVGAHPLTSHVLRSAAAERLEPGASADG